MSDEPKLELASYLEDDIVDPHSPLVAEEASSQKLLLSDGEKLHKQASAPSCNQLSFSDSFDELSASITLSENASEIGNTDLLLFCANAKREIDILKGLLRQKESENTNLKQCLEERRTDIRNIQLLSDGSYCEVKNIPEESMSLVDFVTLVYREKATQLIKRSNELDSKYLQASQEFIADRDSFLSKLKKADEEKIRAHKEKEDAYFQLQSCRSKYDEATTKIAELQNIIVNSRKKSLQFDDVNHKSNLMVEELRVLRFSLNEMEISKERAVEQSSILGQKVITLEKQCETSTIEKSLMAKEIDMLKEALNDATTSLRESEKNLCNCKLINEKMRTENTREKESLIKEHQENMSNSIESIKLDHSKELSQVRQASDKFVKDEKEKHLQINKNLNDQLKSVQEELSRLKLSHESIKKECFTLRDEREQMTIETCNVVTKKSSQILSMEASNDKLKSEIRKMSARVQFCQDQVVAYEKEYLKLESRAVNERKNFLQEIRDLSEKLEYCLGIELENDGNALSVENTRKMLDHNFELSKKYSRLKTSSKEMSSLLDAEKQRNRELENKVNGYQAKLTNLHEISTELKRSNEVLEENMIKLKESEKITTADLAFMSSERDHLRQLVSKLLHQKQDRYNEHSIEDNDIRSLQNIGKRQPTGNLPFVQDSLEDHLIYCGNRASTSKKTRCFSKKATKSDEDETVQHCKKK